MQDLRKKMISKNGHHECFLCEFFSVLHQGVVAIAAVLYINLYWQHTWVYFIEVGITNCYYVLVNNFPMLSQFKSSQPCKYMELSLCTVLFFFFFFLSCLNISYVKSLSGIICVLQQCYHVKYVCSLFFFFFFFSRLNISHVKYLSRIVYALQQCC